jgi:glycine betaine/proline transport system ATP-binding protein
MSKVAIEIKNLYKIFGKHPKRALKRVQNGIDKDELLDKYNHILGLSDINIDINQGEITVIMGLSGSGKSTLIRHINRLIEPTSGEIKINNQSVMAMSKKELLKLRRHKISMVFQKFGLLPHKTILENIAYGVITQGMKKSEAESRAMYWLKKVGLDNFENNFPPQLSGGMQQRVGLARALATNSDILLMDEAFSALDPLIRTQMQDMLLNLQEELNKTIIFITHDLDEALRLGAKIVILRDGNVVQQGTPEEIVLTPKDEYVASFISDINRGKAIKLKSIIQDGKQDNALNLSARLSLGEALPLVFESKNQIVNVVDKNNLHLGQVSLENIINTIGDKH